MGLIVEKFDTFLIINKPSICKLNLIHRHTLRMIINIKNVKLGINGVWHPLKVGKFQMIYINKIYKTSGGRGDSI